jgi:hypothetical protein
MGLDEAGWGNYLRFIIIAGRLLRSVEDDTLRSRYESNFCAS